MARAKCKRGTSKTVKLSLLSSDAAAVIRQSGTKAAKRMLSKVVEMKTCTGKTSGEVMLVRATVKKGRVSAGPRMKMPAPRAAAPRAKRGSKKVTPVATAASNSYPGYPGVPPEMYESGPVRASQPETYDMPSGMPQTFDGYNY